MSQLFTKENMARLTKDERATLMMLQMSPSSTRFGGGDGNLPEDCSECGACGEAILGTGWCNRCLDSYERLEQKAQGVPA